jgi:hypothetical protein
MSWASVYIEKLNKGETVEFRPKGDSMAGLISNGQLCTVKPIDDTTNIKEGNIVLCRVYGRVYLHLVKATRHGQYQIGNNRGHINGWTVRRNIYGILTDISG